MAREQAREGKKPNDPNESLLVDPMHLNNFPSIDNVSIVTRKGKLNVNAPNLRISRSKVHL